MWPTPTPHDPAKRKRDVVVELAHEQLRRQTRVAQLLGEEQVHRRGVAVEAPPVVPSAKGEKLRPRCRADGVVLAMFELLRAYCAGEDVVAGILLSWARLVAM